MFKTKLVSSNATTTPKLPKTNNLPINLVTIVTIHSQQSKQQVFQERELLKTKGVEEWQQEKHLQDFFIEIIRQLQHSGVDKQPIVINEGSLQNN